MSAKNIVNPDHYKIAGRGRRNEQIVPEVEKQRMARETQQSQERMARRRRPAMDSSAGTGTADAAQWGPREEAGTKGALAARGSRKAAAPGSAGKRARARTSRTAAARTGQRARKGTASKGTARKASPRKSAGTASSAARKRAGARTSRQRQRRR